MILLAAILLVFIGGVTGGGKIRIIAAMVLMVLGGMLIGSARGHDCRCEGKCVREAAR